MSIRFWISAQAGVVVFVLAGCMSAPAPSSVSEPWQAPREAQASPKTWQQTRAQQLDFSRPLALAELADIALQNNPASRKAWNDARVAAAQVAQARSYFMPTITATGNVLRDRMVANPSTLNEDYEQYGPGLQLNYLIFNFGGGTKAAVEQALQTVYAANFTFNRVIQTVLLAVQNSYFGVVSARAGLEAAQAQVQDAHKALEFAQLRLTHGVGTELDVLQAQAAYDQALLVRVTAAGQTKTAQAALTQALGVPADAAVKIVEPTQTLPAAPDTQRLSQMIDEALQRRPDIAALRAQLAASEAAIRVAGAVQWPSLYATGGINYSANDVRSGQNFVPNNDWSYMGGLSLQWTLFDGLKTLNAKRAAQAQAESMRSQLRQAEIAASADIWNGHQTYATALQKLQFSGAYVRSSQAAYDLALDSYKAGLKTILDLLDAESQLTQARSQHIAARQEAFTALANLAFVSGSLDKENINSPVIAPAEDAK